MLVEHAERVIDELDRRRGSLGRPRRAAWRAGSARVLRHGERDASCRRPSTPSGSGTPTSRCRSSRRPHATAPCDCGAARSTSSWPSTSRRRPTSTSTLLFDDPFRLAVHRNHPAAYAQTVDVAALAGSPWIDVPAEVPGGGVVARTFARLGLTYRLAHQSEDYTAIHEMVGAGLGVALLPDLALFPANPDVVLRHLGPDGPEPARAGGDPARGPPLTGGDGAARGSARVPPARTSPGSRQARRPNPAGRTAAKSGSVRAGRSARNSSIGSSVRPSRQSSDRMRPRTPANLAACPAPMQTVMASWPGSRSMTKSRSGRHVVEAAAGVELGTAVAGQDLLDELADAPDALLVRRPVPRVDVDRLRAQLLRSLRREVAVDREAVELLGAVPDPDREPVGREVTQLRGLEVGDLLVGERDRPAHAQPALEQPGRPGAGAQHHLLGLELAGRRRQAHAVATSTRCRAPRRSGRRWRRCPAPGARCAATALADVEDATVGLEDRGQRRVDAELRPAPHHLGTVEALVGRCRTRPSRPRSCRGSPSPSSFDRRC